MTSPVENAARTGLLAVTQTALGCGAGLLIARSMRPTAQKITAWAILSLGLATTVPIVVDFVMKNVNHPGSERSMRKRLDSIRQDSGFPDEADIY